MVCKLNFDKAIFKKRKLIVYPHVLDLDIGIELSLQY